MASVEKDSFREEGKEKEEGQRVVDTINLTGCPDESAGMEEGSEAPEGRTGDGCVGWSTKRPYRARHSGPGRGISSGDRTRPFEGSRWIEEETSPEEDVREGKEGRDDTEKREKADDWRGQGAVSHVGDDSETGEREKAAADAILDEVVARGGIFAEAAAGMRAATIAAEQGPPAATELTWKIGEVLVALGLPAEDAEKVDGQGGSEGSAGTASGHVGGREGSGDRGGGLGEVAAAMQAATLAAEQGILAATELTRKVREVSVALGLPAENAEKVVGQGGSGRSSGSAS
eukprot:264858-Rhodomonas_salina.1